MSESLDQRIQKAKKSYADVHEPHAKKRKEKKEMNAGMELGFQVGLEMVAAPAVGGFLGYYVDSLLETSPWGLVIGLILGFVAAIFGIQRLVARYEAKRKVEME